MDIKIGEKIIPTKLGERGFDPIELFHNMKNLQTVWCWGASSWKIHKDKWLRFKSNGFLFKGHVYITLGWNDTFTIIYTSIMGKVIDIQTDIYVDVLIETIDKKIETK